MQGTELLAPARDLECGIAAVNGGADAVYIGAARFGARSKAGNSLQDIEALAEYAHKYWARVYVTVNTLLYDRELPQAVRLIEQIDEAGADAVIIQDVGLLECDLPPIPLIASTQMHNHTPERVAFLEKVGFRRVILARELSLEQIRAIRRQTTIELEAFVHGALCVCYSGQCYVSYAIGGRSGNRGECAQPCRRRYSLVDRSGKPLARDRHLLSLHDLNLSHHLDELLDAGVCSFKIEGRLKDKAYVTNVVSAYRRALDAILEARGWARSSSGGSRLDVVPDLSKTFNRGYTTHFLDGRETSPGAIDTPKMQGEFVGRVTAVRKRSFTLDRDAPLHNGDGLTFFDSSHTLQGTVVTGVKGRTVIPDRMAHIASGTSIYRNRDHDFLRRLDRSRAERRIAVQLTLGETAEGLILWATDDNGNRAAGEVACEKVPAEKPEKALAAAERQLRKMGGTEFTCSGLEIEWRETYFVPLSALNALRRSTLERLAAARAANRPVSRQAITPNNAPYPQTRLTYLGNVLNEQAAAFYRRHGVTEIEPAAESGLDMTGRRVMRTRYCLLHHLGLCQRERPDADLQEPLYLVDDDGHRYRLRFDCAACEMEVYY